MSRFSPYIMLLVTCLATAQPLAADTLIFYTGGQASGRVLSQTKDQVTVDVGNSGQAASYPRADVKEIILDAPAVVSALEEVLKDVLPEGTWLAQVLTLKSDSLDNAINARLAQAQANIVLVARGNQFFQDGTKAFSGRYEIYRPDRSVALSAVFKDGRTEGHLLEYHDNRKLHVDSFFENGIPVQAAKIYDRTGVLRTLIAFDNGQVSGIGRYDAAGRIVSSVWR